MARYVLLRRVWKKPVDAEHLNRWLTLAANLGVVAGIGLLILELAQNQEMMRAQTRHDISQGIVELLLVPATDGELSDIMYRGKVGDELSPPERFRLNLRINALLRYWEDVHYQFRSGLYDEEEFVKQREAWRAALNNDAGIRTYWCDSRALYADAFSREMDALLAGDAC